MSEIGIGLVQMTLRPGKPEDNLARLNEAATEAFAAGAGIVVLPELGVSGYDLGVGDATGAAAEPVPGPSTEAWMELCRARGGWICGGICERSGDDYFDTAVLVGPDGVLLHYRKLHLFAHEKDLFRPGDLGLPYVDLPFGRVGALVCYDLRFPEVVRILALSDVDIICVPTAWVTGFDRVAYDAGGMPPQARNVLVQANLNQVFIAAASQVGAPGDLRFLGASVLADPRGEPIIGPLSIDDGETSVRVVDVASAKAARSRAELISPRDDRRKDVYSIRYEGRDL